MEYTIELYGKGGESFIHRLTEEQYENLQDGCVEDDAMDTDEISELLGVDFTETDDVITGIYTGNGNIQVIVKDESGEVVWESEDDFDFEEYEEQYLYNDDNYLIVEDYQKGNFFNFILDTEDEFNPQLLSAVVCELLDGRSELVTNIKYDGQDLYKDYGDTVSKGFTYMLS